MRISDWSSDVCSSDLNGARMLPPIDQMEIGSGRASEISPPADPVSRRLGRNCALAASSVASEAARSEEHTSELQSLMRISYAVFCLKKKNSNHDNTIAAVHYTQHNATHQYESNK